MKIDSSELLQTAFVVLIVSFGVCISVAKCTEESKIKVIDYINGYQLVELDDGHYYLRNNRMYDHSLSHYVDCPKCSKLNKQR